MAIHKIWKYQFEISDVVEIEMPGGSTPLSVQVQDGKPTLWVFVDTGKTKIIRRFYIYGTGHPIALEGVAYIGTIQLGQFVWHVFF